MSKKVWLAVFLIVALSVFSEDIDTIEAVSSPYTIADTLNVAQADSIAKPVKSNPFLYNRCVGSAMDGMTFCIPIAIYIFEVYREPHNNFLVYYCAYPVGAVFIEKFIKNMFVHTPSFTSQGPHSYISINGQLGVITPMTRIIDNGGPIINMDAKGFYRVALEYEYQLNSSFGIQLRGERIGSTGNLTGDYLYRFFGYSLGLRLTDWNINVNKILFGYSFKDGSSKEYGYDFWGFGIGWSKRYYPYKGLLIEPNIAYRYSRTSDYSVSIIGLFGGVNIGYRF